ncbi:MAG TPA: hypothetical protein VHY35_19185 [Stellaceae bacterium]|nr:hypothetical protein [Stellaceae bacterium]
MVVLERELRKAPVLLAPASTPDAIPLPLRRHGGSSRQVLALSLVGTLVLAIFASRDLSSWLDRLGDGPVMGPLQHAAAAWDGAMDRLGLTGMHDLLRRDIERLLDWEWGAPP